METQEVRKELQSLLQEVQEIAPIPYNERDALRTLSALLTTSDLWEVFRLSYTPIRFVCTFLQLLLQREMAVIEGEAVILTEKGRAFAKALRVFPVRKATCGACEGRGIQTNDLLGGITEKFTRICQHRPPARKEYNQGFITPEATLARVAFLWEREDLEAKAIIILGDDDLMGVAAALTGVPQQVVVLEIDDRLVKFINQIAQQEGLENLQAVRYDLREALPQEWIASFDTFLCDPAESFIGFKLFIERGLLALKGVGGAGYFGLTYIEASLTKWQKFQHFLLASGTVITDVLRDFSGYVNASEGDYGEQQMQLWNWLPVKVLPSHLWYYSAFYRVELLEKKPLPNEPVKGDIFSDEENATV